MLVDLGRCDAETRRLVGSLIVIGLEQGARSRKDARGNRRPFYFCIDEFQDFCANDGAAQTLAQILSECRKFGLHLTLAHQTLAVGVVLTTLALKGWRWQLMFPDDSAPVPFRAAFWSTTLGQYVNLIIPFLRLGEVARPDRGVVW